MHQESFQSCRDRRIVGEVCEATAVRGDGRFAARHKVNIIYIVRYIVERNPG